MPMNATLLAEEINTAFNSWKNSNKITTDFEKIEKYDSDGNPILETVSVESEPELNDQFEQFITIIAEKIIAHIKTNMLLPANTGTIPPAVLGASVAGGPVTANIVAPTVTIPPVGGVL